MLFVGTSIIHPSTEGVFLLCNILDLLIYRINVDFIESSLYTTKFYSIYGQKKKLWMYTIVVFTKKQRQEEIILCAMYCGKKRNFYLIRQKH